MDRMEDPNAHDITRLKAAELAVEMANAVFRTSYEGVFWVKDQAEKDIEKYSSPSAFQYYLIRNGIVCKTLEQYKKARHKFDNEEEKRRKKKKRLL